MLLVNIVDLDRYKYTVEFLMVIFNIRSDKNKNSF